MGFFAKLLGDDYRFLTLEIIMKRVALLAIMAFALVACGNPAEKKVETKATTTETTTTDTGPKSDIPADSSTAAPDSNSSTTTKDTTTTTEPAQQ